MFFRVILCLNLGLWLPLFSTFEWQTPVAASEEEVLFLRRIADFWQEGDYDIAKNQIEEFLTLFGPSAFADPLAAAMGDLLLREKNYRAALDYYSKITSSEWIQKIFLNRMQCLYYLEWYANLADECEAQLSQDLDSDLEIKTTYYLAIALYHQCLNAQKDPELSLKLAKRAEPYFETLLNSELSQETAQAFAHLCCILKDFPKASDIYLDLARKEPSFGDEMSFQAALIQAEFDKTKALETFSEVIEKGGKRAKEAVYNQMVLLFETGRYQELLDLKKTFLNEIPPEKKGMAYLFLGKSCLALKNYHEAAAELKNFILETPSTELKPLQAAFLSLIEASFQSDDLAGMNLALNKLSELDPKHPEIAKARFSKALLLKKRGNADLAREELKNLLKEFPLRPEAVFELAHLEYSAKNWADCRNDSKIFVAEFPHSELAPFAWRYLASSSASLAAENPEQKELKEVLILDLKSLLQQEEMFSQLERKDWQFFLSKAYFDLGDLERTIESLSEIIKDPSPFAQKPNAYLLLSICYRDEKEDLTSFCNLAETALSDGADLMEKGALHLSLFNAYLVQEGEDCLNKAAKHLYQAFEHKFPISTENLMWLAHYGCEQYQKNKDNNSWAKQASILYKHLLAEANFKDEIEKEGALYKLAKIHSYMNHTQEQISLLNQLVDLYASSPSSSWQYEMETQFLLGEGYAAMGDTLKAASFYDLVAKANPPLRSRLSAKAHLQGAKLRLKSLIEKKGSLDHPETIQVLATLKDLTLQKVLLHEPVHLEAAFEYAQLKETMHGKPLANRSELFKKIKANFESQEDLLSKDYHQCMQQFPDKEKIYLGYMQLADAEILLSSAQSGSESEQKELQAKGKDLLLEIIKGKAHPSLVSRATSRLQAINAAAPN